MQVMALLEDIRLRDRLTSKFKQVTLVTVSFSLALVLSGCTYAQLDGMRPEVNNGQAMVVLPEQYGGINDLEAEDGTSNPAGGTGGGLDGGGAGGDSGGGGTVVNNPSSFAPLPYNVVAAGSYSAYLDSQVYQPISEILAGLPNNASNHLYFRVFHSGYDPVTEDATLICRASVYDSKQIGSVNYIAGTAFPMFTYKWLALRTDLNPNVVSSARSNWLSRINSSNVTPQTTWLDAAGSPDVPTTLVQMWGNERLGADTLADYLQLVRSDVIGVIPNISFKLQLNAASKTTVTINSTAAISSTRYSDRMAKTDVDRLFGYYNQYSDRRAITVEFYEYDDYSAVFSYIDGYSKTIVALGCQEGYSFDDLLGAQKDVILGKIGDTLNYTQWTDVQAFVENAVVLQSGVRGMD